MRKGLFGWFGKKETYAEMVNRNLREFNEENLPLEHLPELDAPLAHNPPVGLDVNIPHLLGQIIPRKRARLLREKERMEKRLEVIERELELLAGLEEVTDSAR